MRIITIYKDLYNTEDLKTFPELKDILLSKYRNINVEDYPWYVATEEDYIQILEDKGYVNPQINFTISYSQGDGASFTCREVDISKVVTNNKYFSKREQNILSALSSYNFIAISIKRYNYMYYHEYTTHVDIEERLKSEWQQIQRIVNKLCLYIQEDIIQLSKKLYVDLCRDYEVFTSDDAVLEALESYEFDADGNLY